MVDDHARRLDDEDVGGIPEEDEQTTGDERALEAVEHLQAAALEMVRAARACLDILEAIVENPTPLFEAAAAAGRAAASSAHFPGFPGAGTPAPPAGGAKAARPKVERIRVDED